MLKLIINGDDFGFDEKIDESILQSFRNGILRSTSLMANGKSFDNAVRIAKSNLELDIGLHLTLVGEKPVLEPNEIISLVNENGSLFKDTLEFSKKYYSEKISLKEIRKEIAAQIEKVLDNGIKISHIDSHKHLHLFPKVMNIIVELTDKYKIKFIRFPREIFYLYMFTNQRSLRKLAEMVIVNHFCSKIKNKIPVRTDFFFGFYFGGNLNKQNLLTIIHNLPAQGTCELMCHPGLLNNSQANTKVSYRQVEEMHALIDTEVAELLMKKGIAITSFDKLT